MNALTWPDGSPMPTLSADAARRAVRNLDAEVRFVEEGHRARLEPGGSIRVVSDTRPGKSYRVTFYGVGDLGPIVFRCCPIGDTTGGHHDLTGDPGRVPCKHAAGAARRLDGEGLAHLVDGAWHTTTSAPAPAEPVDPWAGLR